MKTSDLFDNQKILISEGSGLLGEAGVGRIVKGVNTTPDVGPGEIKKQAAKLGMQTDIDGRPPVASTNGKISQIRK